MRAKQLGDGTLVGVGYGDPRPGEIEFDEVVWGQVGQPLVLDPANPRRAIPAPKADAVATREREDRLIDLELRRAAAERLGLLERARALAGQIEAHRKDVGPG